MTLLNIKRESRISKFIIIALGTIAQVNITISAIHTINSISILFPELSRTLSSQPHPTILTIIGFFKVSRNLESESIDRLASTTDSDNLSCCIIIDIKAKSFSNKAQRNHGRSTLNLGRRRHANRVAIHIRSITANGHHNRRILIVCNRSISRRIPTDRCTRKTIDNRSQRNHCAAILDIRTDITVTLLNHIGIVISGICCHIRQIAIVDHIIIDLESHIKTFIFTNYIENLLIICLVNITALEVSIPASIISTFHFLNQCSTLIEIGPRYIGLRIWSKNICFVSVDTYSDIGSSIDAIISDAMITSKQVSGYTSLPK